MVRRQSRICVAGVVLGLISAALVVGGIAHMAATWARNGHMPAASALIRVESAPSATAAQPPAASADDLRLAQALSRAFTQAAERIAPSVVHIRTTHIARQLVPRGFFLEPLETRREGAGSGVIVTSDGYILTNHHVIQNAVEVEVTLYDGRRFTGTIVGSDEATDLGLVRIATSGLTPARFGDSDALQVGDWVLAIGSPFGVFTNSVTAGIVSAKGRTQLAGPRDALQDFIQTDAAINPGNSGGPLINLQAEVVGINSQIASRTGGFEGLSFAIPSSIARPVMDMLMRHGRLVRGWLGITPQPLAGDSTQGVLVADVVRDGPAWRAGLRPGDIIIRFNGRPVTSPNRLRTTAALTEPGTVVPVEIVRRGQPMSLTVEIGDYETGQALLPGHRALPAYGFAVGPTPDQILQRWQLPAPGVMVISVEDGSPAYAAGLRLNDVIVYIGRTPVGSVAEFDRFIEESRGRRLRLGVLRPGTGDSGFIVVNPR